SFAEMLPKFSPDGKYVAYWSDDSGTESLYVTPFPGPGGKYQIASDGDENFAAQWAPDGREIFYKSRDLSIDAVRITPQGGALEIGAPQKLFQISSLDFWLLSRDGKEFLLGRVPQAPRSAPITLMTEWISKLKR
ncbi:MAG TPA: hypothetical protein VGR38_06560, partial [Candidatus Polarisedimenticolia bacterium]|nr:hypothetical protein [Candidatus Polarisedimenticolia bacterium]